MICALLAAETFTGISAATARPFFPPLSFQVIDCANPGKNEKMSIQEGKCHQCRKWIPMEGVKDVEVKVKEIFWYDTQFVPPIIVICL
jgi:chloramphenicol O-acetyltransferase